jgi:hypothetical protein
MPPPEPDADDLDALGDTTLDSFKAEPPAIGPFSGSHLSWSVTAPERVKVQLDGAIVSKHGGQNVAPDSTHSYHLSAKAGRLTKPLGTVAVQVNLSQCIEISTTILEKFIEPFIQDRIDADTSGIYFRNLAVVDSHGVITHVRAKPKLWITPGRINILLQLAQHVDNFPDPDVDISVSFGLGMVADGLTVLTSRRIVSVNEEINVDVTFPWYAWLVPGALIGLSVAIDGGKERGRARAREMIQEIVGPPNPPPLNGQHNLNNFFAPPAQVPNAQKHDVRLYLDQDGRGTFGVVFCPRNNVVFG